jgi:hypothetical protein
VFLAAAAPGAGQERENRARPLSIRDPLPELPVSGVLDEGNVFNVEEEALMAGDIGEFRQRVGMPVFVVTANYIFGDTVDKYGEHLVTGWLRGNEGMVLLYERGSGQLNYSATPGTPERNEELRSLFVIASKAAAMMPNDATAAQRIRAAVQSLTTAAEIWKTTGKVPSAGSVPPSAPDEHSDPASAPVPAKVNRLPAPPADFVIDAADALDTDEEAGLKSELVKFHSRHDTDIYILTYTILPNTTARARAEELAETWLAERCGAVIVMNRGTADDESALGISGSAQNVQLIPPHILLERMARAREKAGEVQNTPDGSIAKALRAAAEVLMEMFASRGAPALAESAGPTTGSQWRALRGVALALVTGTLLLFFFQRIKERLESRSNEQFFFPEVTVDCRLGATHGGGKVAGICFGPRAPGG